MQVRMLLCLALAALHTTVDGFPRMFLSCATSKVTEIRC